MRIRLLSLTHARTHNQLIVCIQYNYCIPTDYFPTNVIALATVLHRRHLRMS
jgi:hypothetical protein